MAALDLVVPKVKPVSVVSQVSGMLREAILSGQFQPAQRLVERDLARKADVSLATVRESLQQLAREGLVTRKANTGTYVIDLTPEQLREMLHVRLLLEPPAMVMASKRLTPEQAAELDEIATELDRLATVNDSYGVNRLDRRFHRRVWEIAGNRVLTETLTQLCTPFFAFLMIQLSHKHQDLKQRTQSHQPLARCLKNGTGAEVTMAVREHILTSWHPFLGELEIPG